jgi:DNA-directed RNA polymerase
MPMIVRPRRWRTPFWGGYLTKRPGLRLVKQWQNAYHSEAASHPHARGL